MRTFLSCLDALRENNNGRMTHLLSDGKRKGEIPAWIAAHGLNLLSSCHPRAILFTGSLRDTLASWYQQYVHHFRRDVTVVPIGLLGRDWCLETFRLNRRAPDGAMPPGSWTVPDFGRRVHHRSHYTPESLDTLDDIIRRNLQDRPVQFSLDCNHEWLYERKNCLMPCGLTCILAPAADPLQLTAASGRGGEKGRPINPLMQRQAAAYVLSERFRATASVERDFEMRLLDFQNMACIALACRQDPRGMKSTLFDYLICYRFLAGICYRQGMVDRSQALIRFMNRLFAGNLPLTLEMI